MKIGIVTFWWSNDNYGQLLQCYALQKYLRNLGNEVFLIRYKYPGDVKKNPFWIQCLKIFNPFFVVRYLMHKRNVAYVKNEQSINNRHFNDFRSKYIVQSKKNYPSYSDLKNTPPDADVYIVGSDQVWNYWHVKPKLFVNQTHVYFLDFGNPDIKRLSYAASWGVTKLPKAYKIYVSKMLQRFDYISVREESGLDLCRQCGRDDAEWVCDPTLLLNAEVYRSIYKENEIRRCEKKYILLYMLSNECNFNIQHVYDFAASKGLEVVYVTGNGVMNKRSKFYATIPEWLYLIDNAEYVITNSFHCAIFSTIFNKQFGIVKLKGKISSMNIRFDSLFELCGTGNRYLSDSDFSVLNKAYKVKPVKPSENFLKVLSSDKRIFF